MKQATKRRLQRYLDLLMGSGWKIFSNKLENGHIVFSKERSTPKSFNLIGIRVFGESVYIAISVAGVHSVQEKLRDYKHLKTLLAEWGNK